MKNWTPEEIQEQHDNSCVGHCCVTHGCKYGFDITDENGCPLKEFGSGCPVSSGRLEQAHPCELCREYGCWQKDVPKESGQYWAADRNGVDCGIQTVTYDNTGKLVFAGGVIGKRTKFSIGGEDGTTQVYDYSFKGWWWSLPVVPPDPPKRKW